MYPWGCSYIDGHATVRLIARVHIGGATKRVLLALLPAVGVSEAGGMGLAVKAAVVGAMLLVSALAVAWVRRRAAAGRF